MNKKYNSAWKNNEADRILKVKMLRVASRCTLAFLMLFILIAAVSATI